jgi:hypothetical protein
MAKNISKVEVAKSETALRFFISTGNIPANAGENPAESAPAGNEEIFMITLHSLAYQFLSRLGAQFFILVVFLGLRLLNCPEMANAWWPEPHKDIGRNALGVLPDGLRKILEADSENLSALLWGIVEPDYNRVEVTASTSG